MLLAVTVYLICGMGIAYYGIHHLDKDANGHGKFYQMYEDLEGSQRVLLYALAGLIWFPVIVMSIIKGDLKD